MYKFQRYGGYECSSAGDKRFSAFYAKLSNGKTIEEIYQLDIKGYRVYGDDPKLGKGKPPLNKEVDLWNEYLNLWIQWAKENPELIELLAIRSRNCNCVLSDKFANTGVNQARALAFILNNWGRIMEG